MLQRNDIIFFEAEHSLKVLKSRQHSKAISEMSFYFTPKWQALFPSSSLSASPGFVLRTTYTGYLFSYRAIIIISLKLPPLVYLQFNGSVGDFPHVIVALLSSTHFISPWLARRAVAVRVGSF